MIKLKAKMHRNKLNIIEISTGFVFKIKKFIKYFMHQYILLKQLGTKSRIKALVKKLLRNFLRFLVAHPTSKSVVKGMIYCLGITGLVEKFMRKIQDDLVISLGQNHKLKMPILIGNLSPRGLEIYTEIKVTIAAQKNWN